jgi:hypothetical protein
MSGGYDPRDDDSRDRDDGIRDREEDWFQLGRSSGSAGVRSAFASPVKETANAEASIRRATRSSTCSSSRLSKRACDVASC